MKAFIVLTIFSLMNNSLQEDCSCYQRAISPNANNPYASNFQANTA